VLQKSYVEAFSLIVQLHPLRLRRECPSSTTLSVWVLAQRLTFIGLDLPLTPLISIAEKRNKILTYTSETTRAKFGQLRSVRLIHRDQMTTT
jgi:hypothetical protein